jgi:dTDP-4-amino-4,6-dideoxygalactose transaminase
MIHDFPQIGVSDFLNRAGGALEQVSQAPARLLTRDGRSAVFQALTLLARRNPHATQVLVPAYHCGTEIEPIVRCGLKPLFYGIDLFCQPSIEQLARSFSPQVLAVMVTHFNGFPQPIQKIKSLCAQHGVFLFEDCAHVLKSEIPSGRLGSFGDVSIFSLRKHLPVSQGGLLAVNRGDLAPEFSATAPKIIREAKELFAVLRQCARKRLNIHRTPIAEPIETEEISKQAIKAHDFKKDDYALDISRVSRFLVERSDIERIVAIRRRNYAHLQERLRGLKGLRCLFNQLSDGTCPWFYLAEVENPRKLKNHLLTKGIVTVVFWSWFHESFNPADFPEATHLKQHVIALPIHQDLSLSQMDFIADQVTAISSKGL